MSDIELTELCLAAMGWKHLGAVGIEPPKRGEPDPKGLWCLSGGNDWWINPEGHSVCAWCSWLPDPLHDDAQAMVLVKRMHLNLMMVEKVDGRDAGWWRVDAPQPHNITCRHADLNRAIVKTTAKMQLERSHQHPTPHAVP